MERSFKQEKNIFLSSGEEGWGSEQGQRDKQMTGAQTARVLNKILMKFVLFRSKKKGKQTNNYNRIAFFTEEGTLECIIYLFAIFFYFFCYNYYRYYCSQNVL